jgi:hypothetical protein
MRGIVFAKLLILALWASYLAIALAQSTRDTDQQTGPQPRSAACNCSLCSSEKLNERRSLSASQIHRAVDADGRPKLYQDGLLRPRTSSANCMSSAASMSDTAR